MAYVRYPHPGTVHIRTHLSLRRGLPHLPLLGVPWRHDRAVRAAVEPVVGPVRILDVGDEALARVHDLTEIDVQVDLCRAGSGTAMMVAAAALAAAALAAVVVIGRSASTLRFGKGAGG